MRANVVYSIVECQYARVSKIATSVARLDHLARTCSNTPGRQRQVALRVVKQHRRLHYALLNPNNRLTPCQCMSLALQLHALVQIPWIRPHAEPFNTGRFHAYTMRSLARRRRNKSE